MKSDDQTPLTGSELALLAEICPETKNVVSMEFHSGSTIISVTQADWIAIARRFLELGEENRRLTGIIEKHPNYKSRCPYCRAPLYGLTREETDKIQTMYDKAMDEIDKGGSDDTK